MMPLGIRWSAVLTPLITSVWPALWPPWKRTTPCAISVSQSTSLPLPSSPHWVPTTTTLRPVVFVITTSIQKNRRVSRTKCKQGGSYSKGLDDPRATVLRQFAVALEFVDFAVVARQHADHGFALPAQCGDCSTQLGRVLRAVQPRGADYRLERTLGDHRHQFLHVQAESNGRPIATEHGAHF